MREHMRLPLVATICNKHSYITDSVGSMVCAGATHAAAKQFVRCVNSHDDLVVAARQLELAASDIFQLQNAGTLAGPVAWADLYYACKAARDALAAAEPQPEKEKP